MVTGQSGWRSMPALRFPPAESHSFCRYVGGGGGGGLSKTPKEYTGMNGLYPDSCGLSLSLKTHHGSVATVHCNLKWGVWEWKSYGPYRFSIYTVVYLCWVRSSYCLPVHTGRKPQCRHWGFGATSTMHIQIMLKMFLVLTLNYN